MAVDCLTIRSSFIIFSSTSIILLMGKFILSQFLHFETIPPFWTLVDMLTHTQHHFVANANSVTTSIVISKRILLILLHQYKLSTVICTSYYWPIEYQFTDHMVWNGGDDWYTGHRKLYYPYIIFTNILTLFSCLVHDPNEVYKQTWHHGGGKNAVTICKMLL